MKNRRTATVRRSVSRKPRRRGAFWERPTIDDLAARQGVKPLRLDDMLGGWPEDELDDGFERAVVVPDDRRKQ